MLDRFLRLPAWGRWLVGVPAVLLVLAVVAAGSDIAMSAGRVHPGVRVSGVSIGGLARAEAEKRLAAELDPRLDRPVTAVLDEKKWVVEGSRVGVRVDASASVDAALKVGSEASLLTAIGQRARAVFGGVDIPATVDADLAKVSSLLDEIGFAVDVPAKDAGIVVEGVTPKLVPASVGVSLRRDDVQRQLLEAFASEQRTIKLAVDFPAASVSDADAQAALEATRRLLSGPATVVWEQKSWTFTPEQFAKWLRFRAAPASTGSTSAVATSADAPSAEASGTSGPGRMMLKVAFDATEMSSTILPLTGVVGRPPVNAEFIADEGMVSIKASQAGLGPDLVSLASDLGTALSVDGPRQVTLRLSSLEPTLTTQVAKSMGIKERISKYTTTYVASATNRVNNIHVLGDALNNKLIPPGGTFDFNKIVGQRTAAKGYLEAPGIVNGKLVPQYGGGICQIGTTFFNTVFFAGLPFVERKNHSFYISHYPLGRDATVTWNGPNLRWKNDTPNWILIRVSYTNSSVTVSLYGTDPGYEVTYTTSAWSNMRAHRVVEVKDPLLPVGARVVEDGGVDGGNITVVRTVTKAGAVVRTDTFVSKYNPKEETVRVGTKPVSTPATMTPAPTP
jgi:vancomycin resistance protein YoaR